MSGQYALKIAPEQAKEMPMVDLAFAVLKAANTPFYYRDLMMEIAKIKELSDDSVKTVIAQLYTEINIDGRFACVGNNLWGLKRWYPVEKADEALSNTKRPRIINDEDDDDDDPFAGEEGFSSSDEEDEDYISLDDDGETFYEEDDDVDDVADDDVEEAIEDDDADDPDLGKDLEDSVLETDELELSEVDEEEEEFDDEDERDN